MTDEDDEFARIERENAMKGQPYHFTKRKDEDDDIQEYVRPCTNCEYHRKRAQNWRDEAHKQAGHPLPERGWVGLTDEDIALIDWESLITRKDCVKAIEAKLKEKNSG